MTILIKNGRVLDPSVPLDAKMDVLLCDGRIAKVEKSIEESADKVVDAEGLWVTPGLIDLHVHLREPGFEYKETIKTGTLAACRGGYTTVCPMPNTNPATDCEEMVTTVLETAKRDSDIHVLPVGAVTVGQMGEKITDIKAMKAAGIVAISEDGKSVMDAALYRKAMKEAAANDVVVMAHCEDKNLVENGALNAGKKAEELGVKGITNAVEDVITARDILLAKETGAKLHLCHCSTKDSVAMVKAAKENGISVTAEVCPHHFAMCEDDILSDDANYKMNPPLRSREDVEVLKQGLKDGIMEVISTDHAPHSEEEKKKPISEAPFGIVGSETAVCLTITELVDKGYLTPLQMVEKMSTNPAKVIGIDKGTLQPGKIADVALINPTEEYTIDVKEFASKGKNTPFQGKTVHGRVKMTIVDGKIVYQDVRSC